LKSSSLRRYRNLIGGLKEDAGRRRSENVNNDANLRQDTKEGESSAEAYSFIEEPSSNEERSADGRASVALRTIHRARKVGNLHLEGDNNSHCVGFQKAKRQATLILAAYLTCWAPYNLFAMINGFSPKDSSLNKVGR